MGLRDEWVYGMNGYTGGGVYEVMGYSEWGEGVYGMKGYGRVGQMMAAKDYQRLLLLSIPQLAHQ